MAPKAAFRPFQIAALSSALLLRADHAGAIALGDLGDGMEQGVDLVAGAFDLDDQQRLDVERITGADEILADLDRRLVHELDGDRHDAGGDDACDAGAGGFSGVEAEQHRPCTLRRLSGCARSLR